MLNGLQMMRKQAELHPHLRALFVPIFKSASDDWQKFLDEKYEGGKKKVPNPNTKTKDQYPQVALTTALNQSPALSKQVATEYKAWAEKKKKDVKKPEEKKPEEKKPEEKKDDGKYLKVYEGDQKANLASLATPRTPQQTKELQYAANNVSFKGLGAQRFGRARAEDAVAVVDKFFDGPNGRMKADTQATVVLTEYDSGPFSSLLQKGGRVSDTAAGKVIDVKNHTTLDLGKPPANKKNNVHITINVPKNSLATPVGDALLTDRSSKFKVVSVDAKSNSCVLELVTDPEKKRPKFSPRD